MINILSFLIAIILARHHLLTNVQNKLADSASQRQTHIWISRITLKSNSFYTVEFTTRMLDDVFEYTRRVSWRDNSSFTPMTGAPSLGCLFNIQQSGIKSVVDLSGDLFERLKPVKFQFEQHNFGLLDNARPIHHQLPLFPASTILYGPYTLVCLLVRLMYVRQRFEVVLALFSLFCSFFEPETVFKFWGPSTWPFSVLFFVACREKAEVKPIL